MTEPQCQSWGRFPKVQQEVARYHWRSDRLPTEQFEGKPFLPYGNGRSYGDVCLNEGGYVLDCRGLKRLIEFDPVLGILRCEAGVLLSQVLELVVPRGWFVPVSPGTRFVTLGGAIANDVHGKNHHRAGTLGCHIRSFELLRSDGVRMLCSPTENREWFSATIAGLGLTGVITWAELQLVPIQGPHIDQETVCFRALAEFFQLARESDRDFEYTVAWVDCVARGASLGRGVFIRGNHAKQATAGPGSPRWTGLAVPLDPPFSMVNGVVLKLFNKLYFQGHRMARKRRKPVHYESFFYPLDAIAHWNRIYGSRGFLQYQCVVPEPDAESAIGEMLRQIADAGTGSFLSVLKMFGERASPGMLSFPRPGATLALDFPNSGESTLRLLDRLDSITRSAGGAVYPGKDARMSAANFRHYFPNWADLIPFIDPGISSSFWRRVAGEGAR